MVKSLIDKLGQTETGKAKIAVYPEKGMGSSDLTTNTTTGFFNALEKPILYTDEEWLPPPWQVFTFASVRSHQEPTNKTAAF